MKELMELLYNFEITASDFTKLIIEKKNADWVQSGLNYKTGLCFATSLLN